jgi:hypothetical protein
MPLVVKSLKDPNFKLSITPPGLAEIEERAASRVKNKLAGRAASVIEKVLPKETVGRTEVIRYLGRSRPSEEIIQLMGRHPQRVENIVKYDPAFRNSIERAYQSTSGRRDFIDELSDKLRNYTRGQYPVKE